MAMLFGIVELQKLLGVLQTGELAHPKVARHKSMCPVISRSASPVAFAQVQHLLTQGRASATRPCVKTL